VVKIEVNRLDNTHETQSINTLAYKNLTRENPMRTSLQEGGFWTLENSHRFKANFWFRGTDLK